MSRLPINSGLSFSSSSFRCACANAADAASASGITSEIALRKKTVFIVLLLRFVQVCRPNFLLSFRRPAFVAKDVRRTQVYQAWKTRCLPARSLSEYELQRELHVAVLLDVVDVIEKSAACNFD